MKTFLTVPSPIGTLSIGEKDGFITDLLFGLPPKDSNCSITPLLEAAANQLSEYFSGSRKVFELPLHFGGTEFQNRVWQELCNIPYGETISYGELARRIGNPKACRAVGMANNKNKIPIIIPCHRVIGASGNLTGYAYGLEAKRLLLELELNNK